MLSTRTRSPRGRTIVARSANGQPRTYRLAEPAARVAAYRRLAVAILGLDVPTLAGELQSARRSVVRTVSRAHLPLVHAA
jgi:hypothetical protein